MSTIPRLPTASRPDFPDTSATRRVTFVRQGTIDALGSKAIPVFHDPEFEDRTPEDEPHGAYEAAEGHQATARWLSLAITLDDGETAETACHTANEPPSVFGLSWDKALRREAA